MAKTGLSYSQNPYDLERYEELRDMSNELLSELGDITPEQVAFHFEELDEYPTPKVDVRGVVLKGEEILLIREKTDERWAMPGGWCDIGHSPSENIIKEVFEESGLEVKVSRLLSVWDKRKHDHPDDIHYVYKLNFLCEITGGDLSPGHETSGADFFHIDKLPELSRPRNTEAQIKKLFGLAQSGEIDWD